MKTFGLLLKYLRYVVFVGCLPISEVGLKWCTNKARINSEVKLLNSHTNLYNSNISNNASKDSCFGGTFGCLLKALEGFIV